MEKVADLHLHTNHSDGVYSVSEVLKKATEAGIGVISITDHDILTAYKEIDNTNLEVIPGVELSANENGKEVHLLGYFVDINNEYLNEKLYYFRKGRVLRAKQIIMKLKSIGIDVDIDFSKHPSICRPHIARAMLEKGYVKSFKEAFEKFLSEGGPAYVPKNFFNIKETVKIVKAAKGICAIAHPYFGGPKRISGFRSLKEIGVDGIEVFHPEHPSEYTRRLWRIAKEVGFFITGGSDFHNENEHRSERVGIIKIEYEYIENMKRFLYNTI
ncbi:MAG: PHP domain-containing protein [bacterium]|nr:PHP domain-containing protein [bacterium]